MDNRPEEKLSAYIDALNNEQKPPVRDPDEDRELEKLKDVVRLVRMLKEPAWPEEDYPQRLVQAVAAELRSRRSANVKQPVKPIRHKTARRFWVPAVALAVSVLLVVLFYTSGLFRGDIVYAMDKAVSQLFNYHGILEIRTTNAAGEEWLVNRVEIWAEGQKYAIQHADGTLTVNNGQQKWQVNPNTKEVTLLPVLPDPTQSTFDLRDEAKRAVEYPHAVVGFETVAGRQAVRLKISPPGGAEYYLCVDAETYLPVRLQTAMQNALQTTYTLVNFEPNTQIDPQRFVYRVPEGYKVVDNDPGQRVATLEEAAAISGLAPLLPRQAPDSIFAFSDRIVFDYGDTVIVESKPQGEFVPDATAALGRAAGGPLEVLPGELRWRQGGLEIRVTGAKRLELAAQIAADLDVPSADQSLVSKAKVAVPVDMEIVEANQKQVDRGSSPWQLDPLQVALTFVNLQVSPEGIQGEPEIPMAFLKLAANNGVEAIVEVNTGPIERVYLKRLVRQDETGIWSVVGYDPR